MNSRLIALITFLFVTYNCQASYQLQRDMPAVVNPPKLTIRQQLEFHRENIRANAKETEFQLKYPEFLLTPETYKNLSKEEKEDLQKILNRSMEEEFNNRIRNCMDLHPSNTAEKCFCEQLLNCSKVLEDELDTDDVDEEFRKIHFISFKKAQQELAKIIFNPENN